MKSYIVLEKQIKAEECHYRVGALALNTGRGMSQNTSQGIAMILPFVIQVPCQSETQIYFLVNFLLLL